MARKDNSPAISFFSFQDIITSVTGIMFLVMLLLTLLLLMREAVNASPEQTEARRLQEDVRALQERLSQMTSNSEEMRQRLEELRKLDAKTLPQRKEALLRRLEELQREMTQALADEETTKKESERLRTVIADVREKDAPVVEELTELQKELSALEAQKAKMEDATEKSKRMMRFTWDGNISKRPLLVECSGDAILVGTNGVATPLKVFRKKPGAAPMQLESEFLAWAKQQPASEVYFVFLSKPSSFTYAESLARILGDNGYQRGREVLPNDDVRVFEMPGEGQGK